ncbi:saccharopine dehydrogenase [Oleiphilus messinensis]|uniref:Saccharopine dehydrogenase n=1 Tax=Oleiphilus messinensis TaxID=141451 RepID=A0A1Y0IGC2_9GAMM|nr:saccharopine dehydrogenase NADP-binding domain-containing protein [Oleiphilus messinensis]ARU59538.1 saccharopine dehydrogenase [Oleiphilus messinensis]
MDSRNILILGGYGNFGKRIVESLLDFTAVKLIIAGRSLEKASNLCRVCARQDPAALLEPAVLDINDVLFEEQLRKLNPFLIIHTGGPFQGQDYRVPQACINIGCHYIDLADDRRFVCDIGRLNTAAKEKGVLVVTGASFVPGLSATVVDHYVSKFQTLETIDYAIAPGNKAERGEATVRAILSYTGHPFQVFRSNSWALTVN